MHEPRPNIARKGGYKDRTKVPFISYPFQNDAIMEIVDKLGEEDIFCEKSRAMGASWMILYVFYWAWRFKNNVAFLVVSRKEKLVDDKEGNYDSLMGKIDFIEENLPVWLKADRDRSSMHIFNRETRSVIDGETTTGDIGRGGRRTAIMLDEFASFPPGMDHAANSSTFSVSACRIFNSTPKGSANFFAMLHREALEGRICHINLHWTEHPIYVQGLYRGDKGELVKLDDKWNYDPAYPYKLDGKIRSPWYDLEEKRLVVPALVAQELDVDYQGSAGVFFADDLLTDVSRNCVMDPFHFGNLELSPTGHFKGFVPVRGTAQELKLWVHLDDQGNPPAGKYVIGIDVSAGTGASNSCAVIADRVTGEKVAEYAHAKKTPEKFADVCVALARWFHDAYMIWEGQGPGRPFGQRVLDLGYGKVHYRQAEGTTRKKSSDYPGFYTSKQTKREILSDYARAMDDRTFIERSKWCVQECRDFVYLPDGSVDHSASRNTLDASGARENHGDRAMATALCVRGFRDVSKVAEKVEKKAPIGSFGHRQQERRERARKRQHTDLQYF